MAGKSIQIVPVSADDWMVREEGGRELGHYPSEQDALQVARKLAHARGAELLIQDKTSANRAERKSNGFFARLFGR